MATKRITRYFMDEERMNNYYLKLCEQYWSVKWDGVRYGETITASWIVSNDK